MRLIRHGNEKMGSLVWIKIQYGIQLEGILLAILDGKLTVDDARKQYRALETDSASY